LMTCSKVLSSWCLWGSKRKWY